MLECIEILDLDATDLTLALPDNFPDNFCYFLDEIKIKYIKTDRDISGRYIDFDPQSVAHMSGSRRSIIENYRLNEIISNIPSHLEYHENIFLARKNTRTLINEREIETYLAGRGFKKLYVEEYSSLQQIKIIQNAKKIVSIHGASMGPILYNNQDQYSKYVVEIQPVGHAIPVFQNIVSHVEFTGLVPAEI